MQGMEFNLDETSKGETMTNKVKTLGPAQAWKLLEENPRGEEG